MKNKNVTESELFRKANILLLDKNKDHLEELKEKISLLANVEIDNSGFIRGVIEYFYENQEELKKLVNTVKNYKGYNILMDFNELMGQNKSIEDINKRTGIGMEILKNIEERQTQESE